MSFDKEYDDFPRINIFVEIHATNGTGINEDLEIIATIFDQDGKIIGTTSESLYQEDFFALEDFHLIIYDVISRPKKNSCIP